MISKKTTNFLENFGCLDDNDIWGALKSWQNHSDKFFRCYQRCCWNVNSSR